MVLTRGRHNLPMVNRYVAELHLGPRGGAWLEFDPESGREEFLRVAERLCGEFGGVVTERFGGEGAEDKEYWWIEVEEASLLLMRKPGASGGSGPGLGAAPGDVELLRRIGTAFGAREVGRRWRVHGLLRLLAGPRR